MSKNACSLVREAAVARSDLNILYGVIALLEGGTISSACNASVFRIIKICKAQSAKCLDKYDHAVEQVEGLAR